MVSTVFPCTLKCNFKDEIANRMASEKWHWVAHHKKREKRRKKRRSRRRRRTNLSFLPQVREGNDSHTFIVCKSSQCPVHVDILMWLPFSPFSFFTHPFLSLFFLSLSFHQQTHKKEATLMHSIATSHCRLLNL